MPKSKFKLSQKHELLINKISELPTDDDIHYRNFSHDLLTGCHTDFRFNVEDILLSVIEGLTRGTQLEDSGKELTDRAREIIEYFANKEK